MSAISFTPDRLERFKKLLGRYETKRSALLPTLYLAQDQWGKLTPEVMEYVAGLLEIPTPWVCEVVSFYTMFRTRDFGKYCLNICNNITCHMMGAEKVIEAAKEALGISLGEMTSDRQFSLEKVECLGACDKAPVVQVNERYFDCFDAEKTKLLIQELKTKKQPEVQC